MTNIRQSGIIQKSSKRAHFPVKTGRGQFWDPQTSPYLHKRSKMWSRYRFRDGRADGRTDGRMDRRTRFFRPLYTIAPSGAN